MLHRVEGEPADRSFASDVFDQAAFEERLKEARARRAIALANRPTGAGAPLPPRHTPRRPAPAFAADLAAPRPGQTGEETGEPPPGMSRTSAGGASPWAIPSLLARAAHQTAAIGGAPVKIGIFLAGLTVGSLGTLLLGHGGGSDFTPPLAPAAIPRVAETEAIEPGDAKAWSPAAISASEASPDVTPPPAPAAVAEAPATDLPAPVSIAAITPEAAAPVASPSLAVTPDVAAPEVVAPDLATPEVVAPGVVAPEAVEQTPLSQRLAGRPYPRPAPGSADAREESATLSDEDITLVYAPGVAMDAVNEVTAALEEAGIGRTSGAARQEAVDTTEIRYFHEADAAAAQQLAETLGRSDGTSLPTHLVSGETPEPAEGGLQIRLANTKAAPEEILKILLRNGATN